MTNELWLIVASYVSTEDARADLASLDRLYRYGDGIEAYDASLLETDAWGQVAGIDHKSRTQADVTVGPIHTGFNLLFGGRDPLTTVFGGPYLGGEAHPLPGDRRLAQDELKRIADSLGPAAVRVVALILAAETLDVADLFAGSDWGAVEVVEPTEEDSSALAARVLALMQRGAAEHAASRGGE